MRRSRIFKALGYVAFSIAALVLCLYVTFPAQIVGERISHELTKASRGAWSVSRPRSRRCFPLGGMMASGKQGRRPGPQDNAVRRILDRKHDGRPSYPSPRHDEYSAAIVRAPGTDACWVFSPTPYGRRVYSV